MSSQKDTEDNQNIKDIFSLQKIEKEMLDNLENNSNMSEEEKKQIIDKINAIFNMRLDLYKSIGKSAELYKVNFNQTNNTLLQQTSAIDIEEKQLNEMKKNLKKMKDRNFQELRMIEINNYYSSRYSDHINALKILIKFFLALIVNQMAYNYGILPNVIYWAIVIILSSLFAYNFWITLLTMYKRNNMDYSQFDFAPIISDNSTSTSTESSTSLDSNPWFKLPTTCIGQACCTSGMVFDASMNICVVSSNTDTSSQQYSTVSTYT